MAAPTSGEALAFRVRTPAEVRQAPSRESPLFHVARVGQLVKLLGDSVRLVDGSLRVPLVPRGWINADALEPAEDCPSDSGTGAGGAPKVLEPPAGERPWLAHEADAPAGAPAPTAANSPSNFSAGGPLFSVRCAAEVRQAPARESPLYYTVQPGRVVQQFGPIASLQDGTRRVPLLPRGWIDERVLEPLAGEDSELASCNLGVRCAGCNYLVTGITPHHCCKRCAERPGQHGRACQRLVATQDAGRPPAASELAAVPTATANAAAPAAYIAPLAAPDAAAGGSAADAGSLLQLLGDDRRLTRRQRLEGHAQPAEEAVPEPAGPSTSALPGAGRGGGSGGSESRGRAARPNWLDSLDKELEEDLQADACLVERQKDAQRITARVTEILQELNAGGVANIFGSFANGFVTASSDLDLAFRGRDLSSPDAVSLLGSLAKLLPEYGFEGVTQVFQASIPLVKFTDPKSGIEVDFCISNKLGMRNSLLLNAYCEYDARVVQLGRLVKKWAKSHELVGTADGCLNSYAYVLLTIHYLQFLEPPVVPNLQMLATESVPVLDTKWGTADRWETKFVEDTAALSPSKNRRSVGELLLGFFRHFGSTFDWQAHAVCVRLTRPCASVDKFSLANATTIDQWYVEDPFDLRHNLAGKCTLEGRMRILEAMRQAAEVLSDAWASSGGTWARVCGAGATDRCYLKCRISHSMTPETLLAAFQDPRPTRLYFPDPGPGLRQAFLEFANPAARRRAHTRNETYVLDCQLQLHYGSRYGLAEALALGGLSLHEVPPDGAVASS